MVEPVEDGAWRAFGLRPVRMWHGNPPWRICGPASDGMLEVLRQKVLEDKTPAISLRIGEVTGGADEITELKIVDGETRDDKFAD